MVASFEAFMLLPFMLPFYLLAQFFVYIPMGFYAYIVIAFKEVQGDANTFYRRAIRITWEMFKLQLMTLMNVYDLLKEMLVNTPSSAKKDISSIDMMETLELLNQRI